MRPTLEERITFVGREKVWTLSRRGEIAEKNEGPVGLVGLVGVLGR